jgi:L-alanine-DL-glutamate epimerase-like enolase superfamily enzyme
VARLRAVREAVGDDFEIMVDANQCFTLSEALRRGAAYADLGIAWFEEPLPADDIAGHARLDASTPVPIAVGESLYSPTQFAAYIQYGACSIVQVDVARIGGITPWLKVAHLAECHNLAVAPHFLMELHASLTAAVPSAAWVEYIPQLDAVAASRLAIEDGYAVAPGLPGLGIEWRWDEIERRRIHR